MFLLGEAETFLYSPFLDFKSQDKTTGEVPINAFLDETGTPGGNLGKTYAEVRLSVCKHISLQKDWYTTKNTTPPSTLLPDFLSPSPSPLVAAI